MKFYSKCGEDIEEEEEYVLLMSKKNGKVKQFYVFHRECWLGHMGEYFGRV